MELGARCRCTRCPQAGQVVNLVKETASLAASKIDEEMTSDHDKDADLVIEVPVDEEDRERTVDRGSGDCCVGSVGSEMGNLIFPY